MTDIPTECEVCKLPHDFAKYCYGSCRTCGKQWMCENCCFTHDCIPGKGRQLAIISNPAWIMNLMKILEKSNDKNED